MDDQQVIYEIAKAVYARLGPTVDGATVEGLVADVYQAVRGAIAQSPRGGASAGDGLVPELGDAGSRDRVIISVFGLDRPGIVSAVGSILADAECSIVDINQTVVSGKFAMVMVVDRARSTIGVAELKERLREEGARLGVNVYAQREDLFNAMHRV